MYMALSTLSNLKAFTGIFEEGYKNASCSTTNVIVANIKYSLMHCLQMFLRILNDSLDGAVLHKLPTVPNKLF